ncbi:hypothetical protein [Escherichia coli]|uniref:hypothetical protein n=1 Tax=Escherichia coli TaxID=562 RepID=UPI00092DC38C|nr:hypothetical protein [Escherichia coli]APJ79944.1 hypothetical protein RG28_27200 [Escherichia coli]
MSAYYFEGNSIDGFIYLCLFLVVICVVNLLAMFVIPEKFSLQISRGKILVCSVLTGCFSFITLVVFASQSFTMDELDVGRYWKNDCKFLEVNIPTGAFTEPVNKLECAGVIVNVPVAQYEEYIRQWELYKAKMK